MNIHHQVSIKNQCIFVRYGRLFFFLKKRGSRKDVFNKKQKKKITVQNLLESIRGERYEMGIVKHFQRSNQIQTFRHEPTARNPNNVNRV